MINTNYLLNVGKVSHLKSIATRTIKAIRTNTAGTADKELMKSLLVFFKYWCKEGIEELLIN